MGGIHDRLSLGCLAPFGFFLLFLFVCFFVFLREVEEEVFEEIITKLGF